MIADELSRREAIREVERKNEERWDEERRKRIAASLPPPRPTEPHPPSASEIDHLTTYAVVIGRGIACGVNTSGATQRISLWFDRVFTQGTNQYKNYMLTYSQGIQMNAVMQRNGKSPDSCSQVKATFDSFPWP